MRLLLLAALLFTSCNRSKADTGCDGALRSALQARGGEVTSIRPLSETHGTLTVRSEGSESAMDYVCRPDGAGDFDLQVLPRS